MNRVVYKMKNQLTQVIAIFFVTIIPTTIQAQFPGFDSVLAVFKAPIYLNSKQIEPLGDQNGDGYDDFLIWNCRDTTMDIYYGGIPLDTIPKLKIPVNFPHPDGWDGLPQFITIDINNEKRSFWVYNITEVTKINKK